MRGRRWKAKTAALCLLATLGGCQTMQDWRNEVDPIRGGPPIPSGAALPYPGRSSPPGVADSRTGEVPPLQVGGTSTSTAALAGATPVNNDRSTPTPPAPAVSIQVPRPLVQQAPVAPPNPIVPTSGSGFESMPAPVTGESSYEQIQQALAARGVIEQHLDTTGKPGEWFFQCMIPIPNKPSTRLNLFATKVGPLGLAAMRDVLQQIDQGH